MIESFRSKELKRFWVNNDPKGIRPDWLKKVKLILSMLDVAKTPNAMDIIGMNFHALKGTMAGRYAVLISKNWRITFSFNEQNASEIDLEDYHG